VSDLYHDTETGTTGSGIDGTGSGHDTLTYPHHDAAGPGPGRGYESPTEADRYGGYRETEAETQARIAGQDELPTPQQSRETTWGDNPDYYDADLAYEYDGDASAFIAGQDELPTPQQSREATWGDNPDYYDADLASEYDGDATALTPTGHNPDDGQEAAPGTWDHPAGDQHAQARTGTEDTAAEPVAPQAPEPDRGMSEDGHNGTDSVNVAVDHPAAEPGHATIEPGSTLAEQDNLAPKARSSPDAGTEPAEHAAPFDDAANVPAQHADIGLPGQDTARTENELPTSGEASPRADSGTATDHSTPDAQTAQPDDAGPPPDPPDPPGPDNRGDVSPEVQRIAELQAQLAQAKAELDQSKGELLQTKIQLDQANQEIADLKTKGDEQASIEEAEQLPADADQHVADAIEQDESTHRPDTLSEQGAENPMIAERKTTDLAREQKLGRQGEHTLLRKAVSADSLALTGTLIDAYDAVSKFAMHAPLDAMTPLAAVAAGLISLGLAKAEKHGKEKNKE
jgi:hypothetical protein